MDEAVKPRMSRRMRIVLGVSLALNLMVVGVLAGAFLRMGGPPSRGPSMSYAIPYVKALPHETRRAIFKKVRASGPSGGREERRALYARMVEALKADPYEASAVVSVLDLQSAAATGRQQAAQAAWLDVVAKMDAQERANYADEVAEVLRRGPKKTRDRKSRD